MAHDQRQLGLSRVLLLSGGLVYLGWWLFVHIALPRAFNPLPGRLAVVACFFAVFAATFFIEAVARHVDRWLAFCGCLATAHYFYLFVNNHLDADWVIGAFITVIAICAILQSVRQLLAYSLFVTGLSMALLAVQHGPTSVVFLPGMITILLFANLGLRGRLELLARLRESSQKLGDAEKARALYDATREAVRIRDDFISIASHELKTPLTALRLRTDLANRSLSQGKEDIFEREWVRRFLSLADSQTLQLTKLVDDMLDLSRLTAGKLSLSMEPLDLSEVVRQTTASLADLLAFAHCELRLEVTPAVRVIADRARMEQLVAGLLSNVTKYGAGQPASLALQVVGGEAVLSVKDGGIGIAKESQARIFEKFERAVSPRNFSGLGLGLYICRKIVEAHRGRIDVESEPGQGAVFRVRLPLAPPPT